MSVFKDAFARFLTEVYMVLVLVKGTDINHWLKVELIDSVVKYNHILFFVFLGILLFLYRGQGILGFFRKWIRPG